jgi:hypothetical protein
MIQYSGPVGRSSESENASSISGCF